MTKILIFVPHADMKEKFENLIAKMDIEDDIQIELTYVIGTPTSLAENKDVDIFVARGVTYERLKALFPEKHMVKIQFTSFGILDALIQSRNTYHPNRIALCLQNMEISQMSELEELCHAHIDLYNVWSEETAKEAVELGQERGTDVWIGAGTVCRVCDKKELRCVQIKVSLENVKVALQEAVNTARTLNRERASNSMFRAIINESSNGIITIDSKGIVQQINNQAYMQFHLSTVDNIKGYPIAVVDKHFKWKQAMEKDGIRDEVLKMEDGRRFFVQYTPILVDEINSGLVLMIKNSAEILKEENKIRHSLGEKGLVAKYTFSDIIGNSDAIRDNIRMANRFSKVDSNVLIIGETGTGKELFAHSIHQTSNRSTEPFVALNCAVLPETLLESELFGYEPGAFSGASRNGKIGLFELAHRGTIFLDEIGEIPISIQAKLLRVLQEKEIRRIGGNTVQPIDVRVISATNVDIEKQIEEGKFRSDLYYRLNLLDIYIPPLRERKEDIQEIVDFYLNRFSCDMKKSPAKLTKEAAALLKNYSWPGNVRELRNICERLVVLNDTDEITKADLMQFKIFRQSGEEKEKKPDEETILRQLKPQKTKQDLARELGVSRTTLWRMMKQQENERNEKGRRWGDNF